MEKARIVIVGGGPAGIATAVEAKAAGIDPVVVLEKTDHACDTMVRLYRTGKRVDPIYRKIEVKAIGRLSFATETREDFLNRMKKVITEHDLNILYDHEVMNIFPADGLFEVQTGQGLVIEAPIVIVAIGVFGKPVRPSYPIIAEVRSRVYFSLPRSPLEGKKVLVVGGGDSAVEAACFLSQTNRVTLSYRRPEFFRINERNIRSLNTYCRLDRMTLKMASDIEAVTSTGDRVRVRFSGGEEILFDAVFYYLGGSTPRSFLEGCGVLFAKNRALVNDHGETNIPRLFLAGDLATDKRTIMTAFNSGARVVEGIGRHYQDLVRSAYASRILVGKTH